MTLCASCQTTKISHTGRKLTITNPFGVLTTYTETVGNITYNHQPIPDLQAFANNVNSQVQNNGYDAFCDPARTIVVQGVISDIIQPSVWIAETQTAADGKVRGLIFDPVSIFALVLLVVGSIAVLTTAFCIIWDKINNHYYLPPDSGITQPVSWDEATTWYHNHYWFVCPKDPSINAGDKTKYASPDAVPASEKNTYAEQCSNAPNIGPGDIMAWVYPLIYLTLAIGGTYLIIKLFSMKGETPRYE